jgi:hypothetical protein
VINPHSWQKLSENNHIDHDRDSEERVFADVVWWDGIDSIHEDLRGVLVEGTLGIPNEGDILDDDFVIDVILALGVENSIWLNSIVKHTTLRDLLRLEAFVLWEVLSVVVTEVIVWDNTSKAETSTNKEVTHDRLESGLAWLEVASCKECTLLTSILNYGRVESILRGSIEVENTFLNSGNAVEDRGSKRLVVLDARH